MRCDQTPLGEWLAQNGGQFHPCLEFRQDEFGASVYATEPLPPNTSAVTCPFTLAITPTSSRVALQPWIGSPTISDHQATCLYLLSHRLPPGVLPSTFELLHRPYIDSLPTSFETPLWWSSSELEWLRSTNLFGAIESREHSRRTEYASLISLLPESKLEMPWELYLWACTVISSRAFPSSLITGPETKDPDPTLFPGVDTLNHRYAERVTWSSDVQSSTPGLSIIIEGSTRPNEQVFNTYGPKPSEEFLLGYGFIPSPNPSDTLILALPQSSFESPSLKCSLQKLGLDKETRFSVPRSGILPRELVDQIRWITAFHHNLRTDTNNPEDDFEKLIEEKGRAGFLGYDKEIDALQNLASMIANKLGGLLMSDPGVVEGLSEQSARRRRMVETYRRGQIEILQAVDEHVDDLMQALVNRAEKEGVDLSEFFGGDEDDEQEADTIQEEYEEE